MIFGIFFLLWYVDHRELPVLTHSCPSLRSSDLVTRPCCCSSSSTGRQVRSTTSLPRRSFRIRLAAPPQYRLRRQLDRRECCPRSDSVGDRQPSRPRSASPRESDPCRARSATSDRPRHPPDRKSTRLNSSH